MGNDKNKYKYWAIALSMSLMIPFFTGCADNGNTSLKENTEATETLNVQKDGSISTENVEEQENITAEDMDEEYVISDAVDDNYKLTAMQRNSINMLNYLSVLVQEINNSSNNRLFLESAYSELINDTEPSIVDDLTLDEYEKILSIIDGYRMVAVKRERLQYIYEQNSASAIRAAMPNPLTVLNIVQSDNPLKALASVAYLAVNSVNSYQSYTDQLDRQYLQDGWELDDEETKNLSDSRSSMFSYMVRISRNLPKGITLNEEDIDEFVKWKNEENVTSRIRWLESKKDIYENYGEYWLILADSYYEIAQTEGKSYYIKCLFAIDAYEKLDNSIFREDVRFAQSLPFAIVAAQEVLEQSEYEETIQRYAQLIIENTANNVKKNWSLRYFAAQTFADLYAKTGKNSYLQNAYEIIYDNVNELITEQRELNEKFISDVEQESTKDIDKVHKKQIENYNKLLREKRKTEVAPVYEPLRLNCDLLFALAKELNISTDKKDELERILHPGGTALFLNPVIDDMYKYAIDKKGHDTDKIEVTYDNNKIIIPAMYLSDTSVISVTVQDESDTLIITDWVLNEVKRNKSDDISEFTATYVSKEAKDIDYQDGAKVTISLKPILYSENESDNIEFVFRAREKTIAWILHSMSFERVYE